jgi:TonB family protein
VNSAWLIATAVTVAGHGALAAWLAQREPEPRPPVARTVVAFKVIPPEPVVEAEPPPEPPPPPPPPRLIKRERPVPQPPPPDGATQTHLEPKESGLVPDQSADQGTMAVQGGRGIDGAIQKGTGTEKTPVPPAPRPPAKKFVPIFEVSRMPRAIRPVQPLVPEAFRSASREAVVVVEVAISASGRVIDARVIKKAGFGLDESALAAARKTVFEPALVGDRPVAVKMQIPYRFKVRG